MCNLLNGIYYYFSFNGFSYLLNFYWPTTTPAPPHPLSHSRPSPAYLVLESAKYLEFCGLFFLFIFWSEQSSSRTKSACLGSLLRTYGVFSDIHKKYDLRDLCRSIHAIYECWMQAELRSYDNTDDTCIANCTDDIVMLACERRHFMQIWLLVKKINEWKFGRHHIWTFISQLKLLVLN